MTCNTESKVIGDHEYSATQWSAEKAMLTKFKLIKVFGSSLALLGGGETDSKNENEGKTNAELLSKGLGVLFENSSPEEITSLIKTCVLGTACDGTKITESSFTELFSGDTLLELYQVFFFVLKVNFANLMKGQLVDSLLARVKGNL